MDPNETLDRLRAAARQISEGRGGPFVVATLANEAASLDAWIMGGGDLPAEWESARGRRG